MRFSRWCLPVLLCLAMAGGAGAYEENFEAKNSFYVEMLGNGGLYSLNYDRIIVTFDGRHRLGARIGFSLVPVDTYTVQFPLVFPLTCNYLWGKQRRFEAGAGVTLRVVFDQQWNPTLHLHPAATLGYRLQRSDNDFVFRLGFTPLFFNGFLPWVGISLGRAF